MISITKKNSFQHIIIICFFFLSSFSFSQKRELDEYVRYLDSAETYAYEAPELAERYLDSIDEPIDLNIKGHLACYYQTKGIINGKKKEQAKLNQNYLLALKYAEKEKNYEVAGMANLELFANIYTIKKDTSAFKYLKQAKYYYTLADNKGRLLEVMQMEAYKKMLDKDYEESNKLILSNLNRYKAFKEDGYYYMYALFMLTSNYLHLGELSSAYKYFKVFKTTENDSTISQSIIKSYKTSLFNCMAESQLKLKQLDSTLYYLKKAGKLKQYMNIDDIKVYYQYHIDTYKLQGDLKLSNVYIDSLKQFQNQLLEENLDASFQINETLFQTEKSLKNETQKKHLNRYLIGLLLVVLFGFFMFIILRYKKIKQSINEFTQRDSEFSFLKSNHEKLKVKVKGLEDYVAEVKKEMKSISSVDNVLEQRIRIKELYKNLHLNSSTILAKGESHLELINELNVDFFTQISDKYPQLNHSEIIICYYLFTGFKNKEIAIFLNSTVRAVESKRYRINKKLNIKDSITLTEFIDDAFKEIKKLN